MHHRLGEEIIEETAVTPLAARRIDVEERICLSAADRITVETGKNENACAQCDVVDIESSREMHASGNTGTLTRDDRTVDLRQRSRAA